MDYFIQPYVNEGEDYLEGINNTTRKFLASQGLPQPTIRPYLESGLQEMEYNALATDDPLRPIVPSVQKVGPAPTVSIAESQGCGGPLDITDFCIAAGPVVIPFSQITKDLIISVEVEVGDGSVVFNSIDTTVTYTPGTALNVTIKATTLKGNVCRAYLTIPTTCCACTGLSIGYTSQQMAVGQQQTLTVQGAVADCQNPACYTWTIILGGGTLSTPVGLSTIYTAPATNVGCLNNPTIALLCNGAQVATLKLAVNQYTGVADAVQWCYYNGSNNYGCGGGWWCVKHYRCNGMPLVIPTDCTINPFCPVSGGLCANPVACSPSYCTYPNQWVDVRGGLVGCCPYQLL